jgi:YcxB-like protein
MTITCDLTDADYRAFRRHMMFRYQKIHWFYCALLVLLLSLTWFGGKPEETVTDKIYLLVGTAFTFGGLTLAFLFIRWLVGRFRGTRFRGPTGQHAFEISDDGLTETSVNGKVETRLTAIRRVDETPQHFFVISSAGIGHVIPKRDLESADALRALQSRVTKAA